MIVDTKSRDESETIRYAECRAAMREITMDARNTLDLRRTL
jgi:hypothetical protein